MISDATLRRILPASAVALLGDLIRWVAWAAVLVVWATYARVYVRMIVLALADPAHTDFTIFYYTSRMVLDGRPMYGMSPAAYGVDWPFSHLGNLNPPHLQALLLPFGFLSYRHALIAWVLVSLSCLIGALVVIGRTLELSWSWPRFWLWGALIIASSAFTTVAVTAELTFVLMLPFTCAWRAWRSERWVAAGAWLGVCASAKVFVLIFLPWLIWRRRWRSAGALVLSAALAFAGGMVAFGFGPYQQWVSTLSAATWSWMPMNASWNGFAVRTIHGGTGITPLLPQFGFLQVAIVPLVLLLLAATLVFALRTPSRDCQFLILFSGALLSSPLGWVYYFPLGLGPFLGSLLEGGRRAETRFAARGPLIVGAFGFLLLYVPQELTMRGQPSGLATVTAASTYFWALISLWLAAATVRTA
jgi:hypothetical protein